MASTDTSKRRRGGAKASPQNRAKTGGTPPEATRFKPGQSGNPGGRPKGLGLFIRAQTNDGEELAALMLDVMRGAGKFDGARVPLPLRIEAATWLADRGFGKPVQATTLQGDETAPLRFSINIDRRESGGPDA